jgi:hypothetical protein
MAPPQAPQNISVPSSRLSIAILPEILRLTGPDDRESSDKIRPLQHRKL